jgi:hypothetical protein
MALPTLKLPPIKYLRSCFDYNRTEGSLRWRHRPRNHFGSEREWKRWNIRFAGTAVGYSRRHCRISLAGACYAAHRVIWKLETGNEPPPNIDHKNRDGCDNRFDNLRPATQTNQNCNRERMRNNCSGYTGVSFSRNKWRAVIYLNKVQHHLGYFPTATEAAAAYSEMARKLHGEFHVPERNK